MQNNVLYTPVVGQALQSPMSQGFATPIQVNQSYLAQTQFGNPVVVDPLQFGDQSYISNVVNPDGIAAECKYRQNLDKVEFGRIKGVEVLVFKEAELERTLGGKTTFGTVGNLRVFYFADYDRFVLSVNDWKYTLLKRIPVVSTEPTLGGAVSYTLPTYNGFYTLTVSKIAYPEALQNFETILKDNSKFSMSTDSTTLRQDIISGTSSSTIIQNQSLNASGFPATTNVLQGANVMSNNGLVYTTGISNGGYVSNAGLLSTNQGMYGQQLFVPGQTSFLNQSGMVGQDLYTGSGVVLGSDQQIGNNLPGPLGTGQKIKRGFKRFAFRVSGGLVTPNKRNLNLFQPRDLNSLKRTSEVMATVELFPRKEVERWISYNKEIARSYGYEAENYVNSSAGPVGQNSSLDAEVYDRMRGYGSVDLGQGTLSNPVSLDLITSERKPTTNYLGGRSTVGPSGRQNYGGYSVPSSMDKFKSKIGGTHHYHGEKTGEHSIGHQGLNGPREMTITQGQVIATNFVESNPVQTTETSTVVQRLEDKFIAEEQVVEGTNVIGQTLIQEERQTLAAPVTEIVTQETYIQENPSVTQRIGTGIMNETAQFADQGVMTGNLVAGAPLQEGFVQNIQTTPSILQRVENRIAGLENPPVQYVQQQVYTTQGLPNIGLPSGVVLGRDSQHPTFKDKVKGFFRGKKADETRIPGAQIPGAQIIRGDGTLYHYQA